VLGGGGTTAAEGNEAWADHSVVAGGRRNVAGDDSGTDRTVGEWSAVLAGMDNRATADYASVSGGFANTASNQYSSVSGGGNNIASGECSSVSGGTNRSATGTDDWRAGTLLEDN
jgi:hypothetical protein